MQSDTNERDARTAVGGQLSVSLENRKDDASQPPTSQSVGGGGGEEEVVRYPPTVYRL